ncbi:MAG: exosome complex component [Candidatus Methanomethylophilaceae archaeon]|nr:exosome complex component [Candidatus Methanomethylophilaceae archaeon]MDI3541703.1 exosome complex component [Candidatus Methanomethylophilaceae archaeon]
MPGDLLDDKGLRPGAGTYVLSGKIYSSILGVKSVRSNYVNVIPLSGKYLPQTGDTVVGKIIDIGPSNWLVEINAPYPAPLHVNEVPWKVEFGDTARFLNVGDVVMAKVLMMDETNKIQVTMNESGMRKLQGGHIIEVSYSKVPRIIGRGGSMIQMIKNMTDTRIFVGQNGVIWIEGELENVVAAGKAIKMVDNEAQSSKLTERVKEYLESILPNPAQ